MSPHCFQSARLLQSGQPFVQRFLGLVEPRGLIAETCLALAHQAQQFLAEADLRRQAVLRLGVNAMHDFDGDLFETVLPLVTLANQLLCEIIGRFFNGFETGPEDGGAFPGVVHEVTHLLGGVGFGCLRGLSSRFRELSSKFGRIL